MTRNQAQRASEQFITHIYYENVIPLIHFLEKLITNDPALFSSVSVNWKRVCGRAAARADRKGECFAGLLSAEIQVEVEGQEAKYLRLRARHRTEPAAKQQDVEKSEMNENKSDSGSTQ